MEEISKSEKVVKKKVPYFMPHSLILPSKHCLSMYKNSAILCWVGLGDFNLLCVAEISCSHGLPFTDDVEQKISSQPR